MKVLQRLGALSVFLVAVVVLIVMQFAVFHRSNRQMAPLSTTATSMLEPTATVTTAPTTTVTTTTATTAATTATPTSTATTMTTTNLLVNNKNNNDDMTTPRPNNRTLVIVMGNLRCGELAWTSLKERVLDVNSADLALMLGYTLPRYQNSTLFDRAKYVWNFTEYDDWGDAMDEMERDERKRVLANTTGGTSGIPGDNRIFRADDPPLPSWRETVLPRLNGSVTFGGVKGYPGCCPGGGIAQNYARYNIQKKIRELNLTSSYDRFMIARSDSFFKFDVNFTRMSNDYIWVPAGCGHRNCDFGGLNDRQVIVSSKDVLTVLDGYPRLARSDASGYKDKLVNGNPESFLKDSFIRAGVMDRLMRYTQPFYSCIATGDQLHVVAMALAKSLTVSTEDGVDAKKKFEYEPIQDRFQQCGRNPACLDQDSDYFSHDMRFSRNRTTG